MKRTIAIALAAMLGMGCAYAQHPQHQHQNCPHQHQCQHAAQQKPTQPAAPQYNADGIEMTVVAAFPTVKSVKKAAKWTEVYDAAGKLLGYAVYSKPASNDIKGFNGETPVMIALNKKKTVIGVYPLPNTETPKFAQRVKDAGLYNSWNGLSIKKAKKKQVDTVSGATFTSRAVVQSVQAALNTL